MTGVDSVLSVTPLIIWVLCVIGSAILMFQGAKQGSSLIVSLGLIPLAIPIMVFPIITQSVSVARVEVNRTIGTVYNMGWNSDRTDLMLARYTENITSKSGDYIIIMGGVNDALAARNVALIESDLQSMYSQGHNAGFRIIAMTITPYKGHVGWDAAGQTKIDAVNTWIMNTATNVDYQLNTYALLEDPATPDTLLPAYDSGDGLHYSALVPAILANHIYTNVNWKRSNIVYAMGDSLTYGASSYPSQLQTRLNT